MTNNNSAGAIWKKVVKTKNGEVEVLSITVGDKRYTAWPNTFKKEGDRSPDYKLVVDDYKPKTESKTTSTNEDLPF